jgi:cysteine desulfurase
MTPYQTTLYGNASAIHTEGQAARRAVEAARTSIARTLGVRSTDVTFTSGGTESNNLALRGTVANLRVSGLAAEDIHIIATGIEHPSIRAVLDTFIREGIIVTFVPVTEEGHIDRNAFSAALTPATRLVTCAYANSETGVVEDLHAIARIIRVHEKATGASVVFHTDASQAPLWLPCELERLGVDMMTLDAGKFCGPKGMGVLVHRARAAVAPVTEGGSQEAGLRPGTENVAGIVGCAMALKIAQEGYESRAAKVSTIRDYGINKLVSIPHVVVNGSRTERLANNINISLLGYDTEYAVVTLDAAGIAASTKSACAGAGSGRSLVVYEMTHDDARATSTIRLTLGEGTTTRDMDRVYEVLMAFIHRMSIVKAVE